MKLESLKETKFKDVVLKREQMFTLNGGGTATPGGTNCYNDPVAGPISYDYGYDAIRNGVRYYHNRTNKEKISGQCIGGRSF